jgi:hypothetical protein
VLRVFSATLLPNLAGLPLALWAVACAKVTDIDVLDRKVGLGSNEASVATDSGASATIDGDACTSGCSQPEASACFDTSRYTGGGLYKADFTDVSDMTINQGASTIAGGAIRLVSTTGIEVGSAYFTTPIPFDEQTSVYAKFAMRIGGGAGPTGTDGMAFVLQNSASGPKAVGIAGGGMGYSGVAPSVEIEFDTFFNPVNDPNGNHVALMAHGQDTVHIAYATPSFDLNDGVQRNVWVDYDASQKLLEVYMSDASQKPSVALLSHSGFDYGAELGAQAYVGFSAASGMSKNDHDLFGEAWVVTTPLPKCR